MDVAYGEFKPVRDGQRVEPAQLEGREQKRCERAQMSMTDGGSRYRRVHFDGKGWARRRPEIVNAVRLEIAGHVGTKNVPVKHPGRAAVRIGGTKG